MKKQTFIKLAKSMNVIVKDVSTYGSHSIMLADETKTKNVARLAIAGTKDLFWDACYKTLMKHFAV